VVLGDLEVVTRRGQQFIEARKLFGLASELYLRRVDEVIAALDRALEYRLRVVVLVQGEIALDRV
jgi:hypothetical protein